MKGSIRKILFVFGVFGIVCFFLWSTSILTSFVLLLILDTITFNVIYKSIKPFFNNNLLSFIKYFYLIIAPLFIGILIRTFFFDIYFVPSSSMEKTLFPGDYVIVNKFKYGTKVPNHFRNLPVIGNLFEPTKNDYDLYRTLKPFSKFKRNDIVVFKSTVNSDKFLIKRLIGLPSDKIKIKESNVFINSQKQEEKANYVYNYVKKQENNISVFRSFSNKEFFNLSSDKKKNYKKNLDEVFNSQFVLFPSFKNGIWSIDNYGDIIIPYKGMKIEITEENIAFYNSTTIKFEGINLKNRYPSGTYVFQRDYYFVMGDNRHNSIDSRSFGFIPASYIQGKMIFKFNFDSP